MGPHSLRVDLEAAQLVALQALIEEVGPRNPFYRDRWSAAGLTARLVSLEEFRRRAPFTGRAELLADHAANPPYGTNLTYPLERYVRFCQTSGTSGAPMRWLDTPESWSWMVDNWTRVFRSCGVSATDRILFAFSFGPFLGFWTAFDAGVQLGALCLPGGGLTSSARLRMLIDNQVTVLCCTPTYALRLAEVATEQGVDLRRGSVRFLVLAGEPGAAIPETRARLEALWPGARAWDHHGMTEVGPVSFGCQARPGVLHILEHAFVAEIVDPETTEPVPRGSVGELVLTNLGRLGSPLVRYRTGDVVRAAPTEVCSCGRIELALEGGILGRWDDMVVVRGVNLYPAVVEGVLRRFPEVAEHRVEVRRDGALAEARVGVEPIPDCADPAALAQRVQDALRDEFHLRIPVTLVPPGSLPRFELKARRWSSLTGA